MNHVVLLGDSIFDNARYVPDRPPVIEQVRRSLPTGWHVTLMAVDGHVTEDVVRQLKGVPSDATQLFVSCGGNDALAESLILHDPCDTVGGALAALNKVADRFRGTYREMLEAVSEVKKNVTVCTIYDAIPGLGLPEKTALALFNDVILREAFLCGLPVIDLRLVCNDAADYSPLSPIEPSVVGGGKIARVIAQVATHHEFLASQSAVYW